MRHFAPTKKKVDPGKEVEDAVKGWLEAQSAASTCFAFHRFPDARAARGALAAQPSDFLVSQRIVEGHGRVTFLEAKDTQQERRLHKSKIGQYGKLYLFWLAGVRVRVVVRRSTLGDWVCLTEADLFSSEDCPPSFLMTNLKSYPDLETLLKDIFK